MSFVNCLLGLALVCACSTSSIASAIGTVEDIQPLKKEQNLKNGQLELQLVNLNTNVGGWYILRVIDRKVNKAIVFNIDNPRAPGIQIQLNPNNPEELQFTSQGKVIETCPDIVNELKKSLPQGFPYTGFCGLRLYLRNRANGYQPNMEKGAQFLREHLGSTGESIINAAKSTIFDGKYTEKVEATSVPAQAQGVETGGLKSALISETTAKKAINQHKLGVLLKSGFSEKSMLVGQWYPAMSFEGVFVSLIAPGMVSEKILKEHTDKVAELAAGESNALAYLVAFDLKKYSLGWAHGTKQPGVGWSDRLSSEQIEKFGGGDGPDGVGSFGDLINPGHVPPAVLQKVIATFSGGFQLHHSHFERGFYSTVNKSTHYGFVDNGVVMAKPNPGLATLYVRIDGSVAMKTWTEADNNELPRIRYLRQNGLPLIENGIPGSYVKNRNHGNWSGSAAGDNYTPRGGACLVERNNESYLVYAYFSAATPNAMARVFQAYGCKSAIHLDMNSPGQSYLSLVELTSQKVVSQHLMRDMAEVDPGKTYTRYLATPDFRDFFWVVKR